MARERSVDGPRAGEPWTGDRALGQRIARARHPLTQPEFAALLTRHAGRTYRRSWLANVEAGVRAIAVDDLVLVARVLRMSVDELLGYESLAAVVRPYEGRLSPRRVAELKGLLARWADE